MFVSVAIVGTKSCSLVVFSLGLHRRSLNTFVGDPDIY